MNLLSHLVAGSALFVLTDEGLVSADRASGAARWVAADGGRPIAVTEREVLVVRPGELVALSLDDGAPTARWPAPIRDDLLVVGLGETRAEVCLHWTAPYRRIRVRKGCCGGMDIEPEQDALLVLPRRPERPSTPRPSSRACRDALAAAAVVDTELVELGPTGPDGSYEVRLRSDDGATLGVWTAAVPSRRAEPLADPGLPSLP